MAERPPKGSKKKPRGPRARRDASFGVVPVHVDAAGVRRYLLIQHHAGHWGFPKGHPEKGESDIDAARRELQEETGITAVALLPEPRLSESYYFRGYGGSRSGSEKDKKVALIHKSVTYFIGFVADPAVRCQEEEVSDHAWGTFDETHARLSFKEGRRILAEAERALAAMAR